MQRNFDRNTVINLSMQQAMSFFEDGRSGSTVALGALLGIRSCLVFMGADDEADKVKDMITRLTAPPFGDIPQEGGCNG